MLGKLKALLQSNQNLFQLIKFTLISCIAAVVELASVNLLGLLLKPLSQPVHWFIFRYTAEDGGLGCMIAFLVSTTLAQIVSYITNRKATFHADNNRFFAVSAYIIMVVCIILFQTWAGPAITIALNKSISNYALCLNISKFSLMTVTFVFVFLMDKFVIMRKAKNNGEAEKEDTPPLPEKEEAAKTE